MAYTEKTKNKLITFFDRYMIFAGIMGQYLFILKPIKSLLLRVQMTYLLTVFL